MTWIKVIPISEADAQLKEAMQASHGLFPKEYGSNVPALKQFEKPDRSGSIVASHSLLPKTLYHSFSAYGTLLAPDLPLSRVQHEMIATTVSVINRCFY